MSTLETGCWPSGGIEERCEVVHVPRLGGGSHSEARGVRRPDDGVFACDERGQVGSAALPRQRPDLDDE